MFKSFKYWCNLHSEDLSIKVVVNMLFRIRVSKIISHMSSVPLELFVSMKMLSF